jgi:HEPN domain-containing protein
MAPAERAAAWVRFAEEDLQMAGLALEEGIWNQVCFHS